MKRPMRADPQLTDVEIRNYKELRTYFKNVFDVADDDFWWGDGVNGETSGWFEYQNRFFVIEVTRTSKTKNEYDFSISETSSKESSDGKNLKEISNASRRDVFNFLSEYIKQSKL